MGINVNDAKIPESKWLNEPGTYDLFIESAKDVISGGRTKLEVECKTVKGEKTRQSFFYGEKSLWVIKSLCISCGLTEKEMSNFDANMLNSRIFNATLTIKKSDEGKDFLNIDAYKLKKSELSPDDFGEDVPF